MSLIPELKIGLLNAWLPILFFYIFMIGISIAAASWILLVIVAVYSAFNHYIIKSEERYCLKTYGVEYRDYMKKTARYFLIF